ncbi:MAG: hypothetical protein AAF412_12870 [Pseudomonadota bacterium]
MPRRHKRGFIKKKEVLEKLRRGRDGAIQVCVEAKINSDEYRAAGRVVESIDELGETLTGDETLFHEVASVTPPKKD